MSEVVEVQAPEVIIAPSKPRFEIPAEAAKTDDPKPAAESAPAEEPAKAEESAKAEEPKPDAPDEAANDDNPKKGLRRLERRIGKVTKDAAEAKAERDFYRTKYEELYQTVNKPAAPIEGSPDISKFSDITEYEKAVRAHEREVTLKQYQQKQHQEAAAAAQQRLVSEWESRVAKAYSKYDDFDEVVGDLRPTAPWSVAIMQTENGDDVAHYLGTHVAEARRIVALDGISQVREIGKLSARLEAAPPKQQTVSKAPAPIKPVSGGAVETGGLPPTDDTARWIKARSKQVHSR